MPFQAYPKDPTDGIAQIIKYLNGTGDMKNLIAGVYDIIGFGLSQAFGDPTDSVVVPEIMNAAFADLHTAMAANPDKMAGLPAWLSPLLTAAVQALLIWLQKNKPTPQIPV